jgi:ATP-dependent Lhr-like helicase
MWLPTIYDQDAPLAERKAKALTLDRDLRHELLGQAQLRTLLDENALAEVELSLQFLDPRRVPRDANELHDRLRRLGVYMVSSLDN